MTRRAALRAAGLVVAGVALLLTTLVGRASQESVPAVLTSESTPPDAYAGSDACRPCHKPAWDAWQRSIHIRMTQPADAATMLGDFESRQTVHDGPDSYAASSSAGRRRITVVTTDTREHVEPRHTLGEKRLQGYLAPLADGRIAVLPLFWHVEWQRWIGWRDLTPAPRTADHQQQIWNVNCFNCHATNISRNFDLATRTFSTTWSEPGVGCEACHGPGRAHIERLRAWGQDRARYPDIDPDHAGPDFSRQLAIFVPRTSTATQVFDSCAYCHGNKVNHFVGFTPGDRLSDFAQPALMSDPVPDTDPQGDFWADGRPSRFNRPQALTLSGCFRTGGATCATCHAAHGSTNEHSLKVPLSRSDELCTQCHTSLPPAHTHHAPASEGSRCVQCHMSDVNWRLLMRRRDHTFAAPVPEVTARFGVPNACTTCHDDRTPEWAAETMTRWYGSGDVERRARAVRTASTLYAALAGDPAALPGVAGLAAVRSNGALIRASAAGFAGRLLGQAVGQPPGAAVVNPLIAAASDPDAVVRASAVTALGQLQGTSGPWVGALVARLTDTARVVRVRAAESLLQLGVTTLPGSTGAALARAQDEYAESLRTFGDVSSQHTALGWLHLSRGEDRDAERELRLAIGLDARAPRPHVYLGVMAARAGRFDEAIRRWTDAKRLDPDDPGIEQMLAEANARRRQR